MTRNKAQKRATRARMAKTGERYTAARRHVVRPKEELRAEDLGQTNANLQKNTGKDWREWFRILDAWGAKERKHGEIVSHLLDGVRRAGVVGSGDHGRLRALPGPSRQAPDPDRVLPGLGVEDVPHRRRKAVQGLHTETSRRNKWLERGTLKVRTTQKDRTARFDFRDGNSRVVAFFDPKDRTKTTVTVQHEKLPDAGAVEDMRAMWKERLARLADLLQG